MMEDVRHRETNKSGLNLDYAWRRAVNIPKFPHSNLSNFSVEIIENILKFLDNKQINRLRSVNRSLRNACDYICRSEFEIKLVLFKNNPKCEYKYAVLKTLKQATWAYSYVGCTPHFVGYVMQRFLQCNYSSEKKRYKAFGTVLGDLRKYYQTCEQIIGEPVGQISKLLFALTFLGSLQNLENAQLQSSEVIDGQLRLQYDVKGAWVGYMWPKASAEQEFDFSSARYEFLVLLIDVMVLVTREHRFRRVCECSSELIKIGTDVTAERDNFPKITFHICLSGTRRILDFIMESIVKLSWDELPKDDFLLTVDFFCMNIPAVEFHGKLTV